MAPLGRLVKMVKLDRPVHRVKQDYLVLLVRLVSVVLKVNLAQLVKKGLLGQVVPLDQLGLVGRVEPVVNQETQVLMVPRENGATMVLRVIQELLGQMEHLVGKEKLDRWDIKDGQGPQATQGQPVTLASLANLDQEVTLDPRVHQVTLVRQVCLAYPVKQDFSVNLVLLVRPVQWGVTDHLDHLGQSGTKAHLDRLAHLLLAIPRCSENKRLFNYTCPTVLNVILQDHANTYPSHIPTYLTAFTGSIRTAV